MIKLPHIITLMLWAFGLVNLFEPFNGLLGLIASFVFYLLLIAHIVEIFIFNNKIKSHSTSYPYGLFMTLLYGVIYLNSLDKK